MQGRDFVGNISQESNASLEFPILQKEKLRHWEVKWLALHHAATKWQNRDSNPVLCDSRVHRLYFLTLRIRGGINQ